MKGLLRVIIVLFALSSFGLKAQNVPQGIHYQTIVRGASNEPLVHKMFPCFSASRITMKLCTRSRRRMPTELGWSIS